MVLERLGDSSEGRALGLCMGLRGEEVELPDAVQGHGGQSVAEQYGRGVALGRMKEALNIALEFPLATTS